ncbi:unnamed protein product [Victoria cruziana]
MGSRPTHLCIGGLALGFYLLENHGRPSLSSLTSLHLPPSLHCCNSIFFIFFPKPQIRGYAFRRGVAGWSRGENSKMIDRKPPPSTR